MSLTDDLVAASASLPAPLRRQEDGSLAGEAVLAERKAFLGRKKLTFGRDYSYQWDCAALRTALQQVATGAGYGFETVLNPKSV